MPRYRNENSKKLCALKVLHPAMFWHEVRAALLLCRGNVREAADYLGASEREVWRWVREKPAVFEGTGHLFSKVKNKSEVPT